MGRDVTCKISLLRATSSLALGKMKWLSHGETRPENCSQLLSLTCNSLGRRWCPLLSRTHSFLRKQPLQQTHQHEQPSWLRQEKGEILPPKSVQPECRELLWLWRMHRGSQGLLAGLEFDGLRSLCEIGVQILLEFKGCLKLPLLKAGDNPGVKHWQPRARAGGAAEHNNSGAAKYSSTW